MACSHKSTCTGTVFRADKIRRCHLPMRVILIISEGCGPLSRHMGSGQSPDCQMVSIVLSIQDGVP